jgi:DNA-binding MarR family transcriptional regulator
MEMVKDADIEKLVERIHRISHRLMSFFDMFEEKSSGNHENLSNIEISIIFKLFKNPQIIMRDLSEDLHISKSGITGIVDHLEGRGYLRRVINRNDRRSYALEITEKGKLVQLQHEKYEKQAYLQFIKAMKMCDISEDYLDQTDKLLDFMENQ